MAKVRVMRSIETKDGLRCVDIFARNDGSFGFEEYRRDPEDRSGWRPTGGFAAVRFNSHSDAMQRARESVGWISEVAAEQSDDGNQYEQ